MLIDHGFVRVAAASPRLRVGDVSYNAGQIIEMMKQAEEAGAAAVLFPELAITGYTCADLFLQPILQKAAIAGLMQIAQAKCKLVTIVGLPVAAGGRLYNCAAVVQGGPGTGHCPQDSPAQLSGIL